MIQKKKYMTREEFIRILRRQKASNLSITDFCHNEGFHRSKFYEWKLRFKITDEELACSPMEDMVGVSPIIIEDRQALPASHSAPMSPPATEPYRPMRQPCKVVDNSEISLELPNGMKLKFKGQSGCKAALSFISKIYNANVLPK